MGIFDRKRQQARQRSAAARRVLYVENGIGYGGAVICLRHLVRHLDRAQYEPLVVTGRGGELYEQIAEDAAWKQIPDRLFNAGPGRSAVESSRWIQRVPGLRFLLNQLLARTDDLLNFLPFFVRLLFLARKYRPALIHANNEPLCNRAALMVGKLSKVPVVCHVRGDPSADAGWFVRQLYRLPDHYIPVSHWVSKAIEDLGVASDRNTSVYDGIAFDGLDIGADGEAFRKDQNIPEDAFAVGLVGMLVSWKGQNLFLDAVKQLGCKIANLRVLFVGGTPDDCAGYARELRRRVAAEGLDEIVTFTGHVFDMARAYNGLDLDVSASTSPEPLGTMVIECMVMQRPLLVPSHGGGAEMVEDGVTGLVFRAGDSESLAEKILECWRDPGLRERLGRAARGKALRTFDVETHARQVQSIYSSVLSPSDAPAART